MREVIGAIIAEDIELPGEATAEDAPKARTKKAKAERERAENVLLVKEGDELTEEVYNRLRRQGINTVKVFASYMTIDLRDEQDAIERGERPMRRVLAVDVVDRGRRSDRRVRPDAHRRADQEAPQGGDQQGAGVRHQRSCREHDDQEHARSRIPPRGTTRRKAASRRSTPSIPKTGEESRSSRSTRCCVRAMRPTR